MRNIFIFLLLVVITISAGVHVDAASISTSGPGNPADVAEAPVHTFVIPATQTYTLNGAATLIGTVPAGCHSLWVISASGPINIGNASVAVGLGGGIQIASGSYLRMNIRSGDTTPAIYMINQTSGASSTARLMYAK